LVFENDATGDSDLKIVLQMVTCEPGIKISSLSELYRFLSSLYLFVYSIFLFLALLEHKGSSDICQRQIYVSDEVLL
jgi:hypothetical protein